MGIVSKKYTRKKSTQRIHGDLANSLIEIAVLQIEQTKSVDFALRDLAHRLGVSHAAAYRHFSSKQALLEAIALRGFQMMNTLAEEKMAGSDRPLEKLGEAYIEFATSQPGYYRVMFSSGFRATKNTDLLTTAQKSMTCLAGIFGEKNLDSINKTIFAWSVVHGLSMFLIDGQLESIDGKPQIAEVKKQMLQFTSIALNQK